MTTIRAAWCLIGIALGCNSGASGSGAGSQAASSPPPARVNCLDLSGAGRASLQLSSDRKTLYYLETPPLGPDDKQPVTTSLYALDLAKQKPELAVSDVDEAQVTRDGTIVFRRPGKLDILGRPLESLFVKHPGKDPAMVSDPEDTVGEFAIDDASGILVFIAGKHLADSLYRVPLAGGKPELVMGDALRILGVLPDKAFLVSGFGDVQRVPSQSGSAASLPNLDPMLFRTSWLVSELHGQLLLEDKVTKKLTVSSLASPATRRPVELDVTDLVRFSDADQAMLVGDRGDHGDKRWSLVAFDGSGVQPVATVTNTRPGGAVVLADGSLAVLSVNDTDGDGTIALSEEADVCFVQPGPPDVEMPARTIPKRFRDAAARLAPLTGQGGIVAGATARFDGSTVVFSLPTGPSELSALRAQAAAAQAAVTKASNLPHLSVEIDVVSNARRARSRWDDNANTFLVTAGIGTAQVSDPSQYAIELDPHVTFTYDERYHSQIGSAKCSGTVKNISDTELDKLVVECHSEMDIETSQPVRVALAPPRLAAGATGIYAGEVDLADGSKPFVVTVFAGDRRLPYVNAFGQKEAAALVDVAVKVQSQTKLAFWDNEVITAGSSYNATREVAYQLIVPKELDGPDASGARSTAAMAAHDVLAAYNRTASNDHDLDIVIVLLHPDRRIGWTLAGSTLQDGPPR